MRGPTAFRRPRWQSHSDTAIGLRGPARRSGRHDTHPMQRRGAKSFVDDLVLSRGVVLSRAAASLRSIETKPFDWQICPPRTDTSPRKARTLSWVEVQGALSLSLVAGSLGRTGSRSPSGTRVSPRFGGGWCGALGDRELFYFAKVPFPPCGLYLVSRQAGHALPRALKAASVVVSSRGRPSRSHLGGGFPAARLPPRLTKSAFRPVPALSESQACLALVRRRGQPAGWGSRVPGRAGSQAK